MRIELTYKSCYPDGRALRLAKSTDHVLPGKISRASIIDVCIIDGPESLTQEDCREIFCDTVAQDMAIDSPRANDPRYAGWQYLIEVMYKPGVTDPVAMTAKEAVANWKGHDEADAATSMTVHTARQYLFTCPTLSPGEQKSLVAFLHNPLIENALVITALEWKAGKHPPVTYTVKVPASDTTIRTFQLSKMDDNELVKFSREKLLALSLDEMLCVKKRFSDREFLALRATYGLTEDITDVEIEMIAQTWSEHCKHKIFSANINYTEDNRQERIQSVFKSYIRKTTELICKKKKYMLSVFNDNSGVVKFDEDTSVCFKVETHNSPSALDPYGGAITGIVGVNRDILGTGKLASPIFNTNYLCFADPRTPENEVPQGFLPPRRIMEGVHRGIIDGGNQSGIPVVAGGFLFDESYIGKPLVFCGTGGIMPARLFNEETWIKHIKPGDLVVMAGGRIGKDGIHGATFSSLALDEESPTSAVQIGDPITQKKMWDFLLEARDKGLFDGITDNGAGGLSSSVGEMAGIAGGVRIDLDKCPLKYQGLSPWEILVSESQERMSIAVDPAHIKEFLTLARHRDVEATVVGEFTDSGLVQIMNGNECVGLLDLEFLHDGLPAMELSARWNAPEISDTGHITSDLQSLTLKILSDANICSRESLVRQYDHEVQGGSIVKPFTGKACDGHSDGAVFKPRYDSWRGITITHGVCPRFGDTDTYWMAANAVDEAFRAHVVLGGDPHQASALDNFCWPDPIVSQSNPDGEYKLAQLVRAAKGLQDSCLAYGLPLISGKDSMKNDAWSGGKKISIRPTLLVSLMGIIPDVRKAITTDFKEPGTVIYLLGTTSDECGGTVLERIAGRSLGPCPRVNTADAMDAYRAFYKAVEKGMIRSAHDLSEGGLGVALAESAIAGRAGCDVVLDNAADSGLADARLLYSESASRILCTVLPKNEKNFEKLFKGLACARIGTVTEKQTINIRRRGREVLDLDLGKAIEAWKGTLA
ncbi:MAG: phosphoribosylformylglycinamidine synthase [Spirochaetaceae bacterium]|nr:MAG: phosphoribosylformylglycinamidine synthase [Spirochaetaceae bacterium]